MTKAVTKKATKKDSYYPYSKRWFYRRSWKNWYYNRKKSPYNMNYFNYKSDYLCDIYIPPLSSEYSFYISSTLISNADVYNGLDIFKPIFDPTTYSLSSPGFKAMNDVFDYVKCKGIAIEYMPFQQIRDVTTYEDARPNLAGCIITRSEYDNVNGAYGGAISSQGNVNDFLERPGTKIFQWKQKYRFYRHFPWSKKDINTYFIDNNILNCYVPLTNQQEFGAVFFLMMNTSPVNRQMFNNDVSKKYGPFAQIRVTTYFRLKSSRY